MKKLNFLVPLFALLGISVSCHKEQVIVKTEPIFSTTSSGRQIRAEAVFHNEVVTSNPMKAGEVYPNPNKAAKARIEYDLWERFQKEFGKDFPGITKEKLLHLKINWVTVSFPNNSSNRCSLLKEYRINQVTLPDGTKLLSAPIVANASTGYCDLKTINEIIRDRLQSILYGKDIAPTLKGNGKLILEYSLTADKELPSTTTGFTVDVKTDLMFQAN